jgi:hypothetical protein
MKRLLLSALVLCLFSVFKLSAQTVEDSMLFDKINAHRASIGLNKLVWDTSAYAMASHHAKYLAITNSSTYGKVLMTHDEKFDIPNFKEMSFEERYNKFIIGNHKFVRENCTGINAPSSFGNKGVIKITDLIFNSWFTSKEGHKENMENKDATKGACHIEYCKINVVLNSGKIVQISYVVAVLDIY